MLSLPKWETNNPAKLADLVRKTLKEDEAKADWEEIIVHS